MSSNEDTVGVLALSGVQDTTGGRDCKMRCGKTVSCITQQLQLTAAPTQSLKSPLQFPATLTLKTTVHKHKQKYKTQTAKCTIEIFSNKYNNIFHFFD